MTASLNRALPRTSSVIQAGIERGLHSGFQIFVSLRGDVIADTGVGEACLSDENGPPRPMTANTLVLWLSAGILAGRHRERYPFWGYGGGLDAL